MHKGRSFLQFAIVVLSAAGMSACAFGTRHAELVYPGDLQQAAAVSRAPSDDPVAVRYFEDKRDEKERVGEVRNNWGMRTAAVQAAGDPIEWVRLALTHELKNAKYNVVESPDGDGNLIVDGQILRVYCTALASYEAQVDLRITAKLGDKTIIDDVYHGTGSAGMNWSASSKSYGTSLTEALQNAVLQFVRDFSGELRKTLKSK